MCIRQHKPNKMCSWTNLQASPPNYWPLTLRPECSEVASLTRLIDGISSILSRWILRFIELTYSGASRSAEPWSPHGGRTAISAGCTNFSDGALSLFSTFGNRENLCSPFAKVRLTTKNNQFQREKTSLTENIIWPKITIISFAFVLPVSKPAKSLQSALAFTVIRKFTHPSEPSEWLSLGDRTPRKKSRLHEDFKSRAI